MNDDIIYGLSEKNLYLTNRRFQISIGKKNFAETIQDACKKIDTPNKQELVKCKDCRYYHGKNEECSVWGFYPPSEGWFCADGERRQY